MPRLLFIACTLLTFRAAHAQERRPEFTKVFSKEEFAQRRDKVFAALGPNGLAVLKGNEGMPGYVTFRQGNDFFYLSGVEAPGAMLLLDGATRQTTRFLPPRNEFRERAEGPLLAPDDYTRQVTGIARVVSVDTFADVLQRLVQTNRSGSTLPATAEKALEILAPLAPKPAETKRPVLPLTAGDIQHIAGIYQNGEQRIEITARDNRLYVKRGSGGESELVKHSDTSFFGGGQFTMIAGDDGRTVYVHSGLRSYARVR